MSFYESSNLQICLDLFDSFDYLDRKIFKNVQFVKYPEDFLNCNKSLEVYRITFNCNSFNPSSIQTELQENKLIISGHKGKPKKNTEDFFYQEFRETIVLPRYVDFEKSRSFFLNSQKLIVIEFTIHLSQRWHKKFLRPRIAHNGKIVKLEILLPEGIDENKISLTCKDCDLVLIADYANQKKTCKIQFIRRTQLPQNTDFSSLNSIFFFLRTRGGAYVWF